MGPFCHSWCEVSELAALREQGAPLPLGFAKAWRNQCECWNESTDIFSLLPPRWENTKHKEFAPLPGSLRKHKVSVKFCFLQWKVLTRVCSVSLVCDVRPGTTRFKNVLGQREPPPVSHNREPSAQAEGRNTMSVLWKQSEQKKTSWKYDLLSAAGCCHEWQKQICLAPVSGWEQTTLQPDRSIKNCCFSQHGKDVADIDVSWYPQPELKSQGCSCKWDSGGTSEQECVTAAEKIKVGPTEGENLFGCLQKNTEEVRLNQLPTSADEGSPGLPVNFHLFSPIALRNVSWQHNTEGSQRLNVLVSNETKPEISFLKDFVCYRKELKGFYKSALLL